ncbi:ABC transporter ATP-binding protein [Roseospira navarrensis]|uniref:ATP-binding cassette domain-containing protein n=1 Tax=Roseospira navarrensis TaxID=140058 RepID=A0A7X2D4H5_9PROT|nr:ABC transporter ATP-binding protein [Roseospira navarrensis]MQX38424.1 ATP-binding cassette domain-containing protein [Roseospira navarrensis]
MLNVEGIDLYYGAAIALKTVSIEARPGQVTCILGRNGVGKTSLMRAICGRHPIAAGEIRLDGAPLHGLRPEARARKGVASVPQGREIFPLLTVRENLEIGFAPLPRKERTIPDEIFEMFPVLRQMLGRRGGDLSGGQQQQLAIGRALVTRPRLLLLDEPTEGIQPSIIKDIGRAIGRLRGKAPTSGPTAEEAEEIRHAVETVRQKGDIAIVLVEQYFDFARDLADTFYVMDRGEIVIQGTGAELKDPAREADVRRRLTV